MYGLPRFIGLSLLCFGLCWSPAAAWQDQGPTINSSGVLVMKDGRMIAIRGEYEVLDQEVHFTHGSGELMVLPLSKVDLKATETRNRQIAEGTLSQDESLTNRKGFKKVKGRPNANPEQSVYVKVSGSEEESAQVEEAQNPFENQEFLEQFKDAEWARWLMDNLRDPDDMPSWTAPVFWGLLVLLALSSFVSFFFQLFLMFRAFQESGLWGFGLIVSFMTQIAVSLGGMMAFGGTGHQGMMWAGIAIGWIYNILVFLYILLNCSGSRLKYLFLWLSPVIGMVLLYAFVLLVMFKVF
ncbi:TIGR04086 family membrane protein [Sulfidibacter corallicola]|uniref:TIGR04086 family membrane protein n=1 Tax=Sulfidibacter corallicola TaxID=2818388 RepID=A0A8A4TS99_SULCO|nr:TIGR04086 family membrane protein [Sulfidibacter corallicola]QTD52420.1 TIGR04086 family membrane protein [Sulfidibacter corallicola]